MSTQLKYPTQFQDLAKVTEGMELQHMAEYIETLRMALMCNETADKIDLHGPNEVSSHFMSALSYLDLADQALRLAHFKSKR